MCNRVGLLRLYSCHLTLCIPLCTVYTFMYCALQSFPMTTIECHLTHMWPMCSLVPRLSPLRARELLRVMTFEPPPLIFTGVQRSSLAISTCVRRGEPGDEASPCGNSSLHFTALYAASES